MIVIKVGGSLFDRPTLKADLQNYLKNFDPSNITLVAGGGHSAEAVRTYDKIHSLGEETAHRLAVKSLAVTADLLRTLTDQRFRVLDAVAFCETDELLPHTWAVTTDSIAARYAQVVGAERLILLKSVTVPADADWRTAVQKGWVDDYFETVASGLAMTIVIERLPEKNVMHHQRVNKS